MPKPAYAVLDTLDDRREIHQMLDRLPPPKRVEFLGWCCSQVKGGLRPTPSRRMTPTMNTAKRDDSASQKLSLDIYFDFWALVTQYGLDPQKAAVELERRVKGKP